jgi:hypothetical protein
MRPITLLIILFLFSCDNSHSDVTGIYGHDKTLAYIYYKNGKAGLLDTNRKVILPAQFDYIEDWQIDNLVRIDSGGEEIKGGDAVGYNFKKYGLINTNGQILFKPQFDDLIVADNSALVRIDSLYGFIDNKGNWLLIPQFKVAYPFYNGTAVAKDSGQFKLINKNGEKVIGETFDTIYSFKNNVAIVSKNKKWGLINYNGKTILPLDNYRGIGEYNWYYGTFLKDGKWFLIDTAGQIPFKEGFDEVRTTEHNDTIFAIGFQNGKAIKLRLK